MRTFYCTTTTVILAVIMVDVSGQILCGVNDNIHITQIHLFCNHFRWLNFGIGQKTISGAGDLAQSSGHVRETLSIKLCPQPRWNICDNRLVVIIVTVMNNNIWSDKHFLHVKYCSKHLICIKQSNFLYEFSLHFREMGARAQGTLKNMNFPSAGNANKSS